MGDEEEKCLFCGPGAKVPAADLYGHFKETDGLACEYKISKSSCGENNLCVCM